MAQQRISQGQLAELAGVSRATVSRALADHPGISDSVTHRIKSLAKSMNYRPNAAARSFVTQRHNAIGMMLCDRKLTSPVYSSLVSAVDKVSREINLKLQVSTCDTDQITKDRLPPILQDDGLDGVILTGSVPPWLLKSLSKWRMPFVLLGTLFGITGVNLVTGDARMGGRVAAEYLLDQGHRRFGLLIGPLRSQLHADYYEGFVEVCVDRGLDRAEIEAGLLEVPSFDINEQIKQVLAMPHKPTAIFADTDFIAWQATQLLGALGVRVPQDISVVGAGNSLSSIPTGVKLTTVDVRLDDMGRAAVQMLREVIELPDASTKRTQIEPRILARATVAQVAN